MRTISQRMALKAQHELDQGAAQLLGPAAIAPATSEVHRVTVDVLTELLTLGQNLSGANTPTHLKVMMRTISAGRPMILESLSDVPPHLIQEWMRSLIARIQPILDIQLPQPLEGPSRMIELEEVPRADTDTSALDRPHPDLSARA